MLRWFSNLLAFLLLTSTITACPSGWYPSLADTTKCYYVGQQKMSWSDAEDYCRSSGGSYSHLTSILSAFDGSEINAIAANNPAIGTLDQVWIGGKGVNDDASFMWVDGNPFVYTNWLAGQPQLAYSCVSTLARSSGRWRTESCDIKNYFICKYIQQPTATPADCYDWHFNNGNSTSGIYQIYPPGTQPFSVYCDMVADGGGWTVIQKRIDGSLLFNQTWSAYKNGFDNGLTNNQWLGNDRIHILSTKDVNVSLRIDIQGHIDYQQGTYDNVTVSDVWNNFRMGDENANYTLQVGTLKSGNLSQYQSPTDFHSYNGNMPFSTQDRSMTSEINCAQSDGGWWYNTAIGAGGCTRTALNGQFGSVFFFWVRYHSNDDNEGVWIFAYQSQMMLRRSS